jgi:hypothetical protein
LWCRSFVIQKWFCFRHEDSRNMIKLIFSHSSFMPKKFSSLLLVHKQLIFPYNVSACTVNVRTTKRDRHRYSRGHEGVYFIALKQFVTVGSSWVPTGTDNMIVCRLDRHVAHLSSSNRWTGTLSGMMIDRVKTKYLERTCPISSSWPPHG